VVWPSSATFFTAIDSPEVEGPMIATTFSSSISCLAKETAFSELPAESLTISSTVSPLMPPALLIFSTTISALRASGPPRKEAGPVTAKIAPTLTVPAVAADSADANTRHPAAHPKAHRLIPLFIFPPFSQNALE